jgi:hypothetical protein
MFWPWPRPFFITAMAGITTYPSPTSGLGTIRSSSATFSKRFVRSCTNIGFPFVQPTKILTPDHREIQLLSRDISPTGIRLIGTRNLQGQKVRVLVPRQDDGGGHWCFLVQILWSSQIGDNLVEHGGVFLELLEPHQLKLRD